MTQNGKDGRLMILLEGNIGAGKTTIGGALAASGKFAFVEEPTAVWREGFAANMLELFYSDAARWAFTFQVCAFVTRAKTWHEISALTDHCRVVLERSIFCDRYVFAENCYRTGLFSLQEYQLYCSMWEFMMSHYCDKPDLILYLRTPAAECLQRLKSRGREEEVGVTLEYLVQLETLHDEWLLGDSRTLVLDGERCWSAENVLAEVDSRLETQHT